MEQCSIEVIRFDSTVFSIETVKKAAYRFLDRFALTVELENNTVVCHLSFPKGASPDAIADTVAEFKKEMLDQDLRKIIAAETSAYRNAILALAFSSSKLTTHE